ncbi:MAG: transposase [Clostridia bacterium]|nr:transposase [Clostridia bacterium]
METIKIRFFLIAERSGGSKHSNDIPFMVTMDRAYPSAPSFLRFIDNGIYFLTRMKTQDFKAEQQEMQSDDEDVDIRLTYNRRRIYHGTSDEKIVNSRDSFKVRFVRVWLDDDHTSYEMLATNLPRDQFPTEAFGELYHLRWRIETAYETLKDRLQLENFTGTKPILIEQDRMIFFLNLCSCWK